MSNAIFGHDNGVLASAISAGSEVAGLSAGNLQAQQTGMASAWRTAGALTPEAGAWFLLDSGDPARQWRAFLLARTNLTPAAQVRWRVGSAEGLFEAAPALDVDFSPERFTAPAGYSFTRADTVAGAAKACGTRWNADGSLEVVPLNAPRYDYDPVTLAYRGVLVEGARTNYVRNPRAVGAAVGVMPTYWSAGLPAGFAAQVVGTGTGTGLTYIDLQITGTNAGAGATFSIWFDAPTGIASGATTAWAVSAFVRLVGGSLSGVALALGVVEVNGAGVGIGGGFPTYFTPTSASLRAQRVVAAYTMSNIGATGMRPTLLGFLPATGAVDFTLRIALPQAEQATFASSPILPTDSTLGASTRGADLIKLAFPNEWRDDEGTAALDYYDPQAGPLSANRGLWGASDGTSANRLLSFIVADRTYLSNRIASAGAVVQSNNTTGHVFGGANRSVMAWRAGTGGAILTDNNAGSSPAGLGDPTAIPPASALTETIRIGGMDTYSGPLFGHVRRWRYYNRRLSDAQVRALAGSGSTLVPAAVTYDSGTVPAGVVPGIGQSLTMAPAAVAGQCCRCDVLDPGNPDGYVSVGGAYAGPVWQPGINVSPATAYAPTRARDVVTTRSGASFVTPRYVQRAWKVDHRGLAAADLWTRLWPLDQAAQLGRNILFVPDPDSANADAEAVFGLLEIGSDVTFETPQGDWRAWSARISERL